MSDTEKSDEPDTETVGYFDPETGAIVIAGGDDDG